MANDDDDSPGPQNSGRPPADYVSLNYKVALVIAILPGFLVGMILVAINLRAYDAVLEINIGSDEEFLQTAQRRACGWPYVLASRDPVTNRWSPSLFGLSIDGIIVFAAVVITSAIMRFVAAAVDDEVMEPVMKQARRLFRRKSKPVAKRKTPSGRLPPSGRMTSSGPPRVRRPRRPVDD